MLDAVRDQVAVVEAPPFNRFQHSFGHIFSSFIGYAAGYYSYKWAEVLSADAFSAFESTNPFDRQVGDRFVSSILERGGSEDACRSLLIYGPRAPGRRAFKTGGYREMNQKRFISGATCPNCGLRTRFLCTRMMKEIMCSARIVTTHSIALSHRPLVASIRPQERR